MGSRPKRTRGGASLAREGQPSRAPKKGARSALAARTRRVVVEGFKCLRDRWDIELRPLTLLAGQNSSGKSSLMQPLLLVKQTLEAPYDPGPLLLDGTCVRFTSAEQLFWRGDRTSGPARELRIGLAENHVGCDIVLRHAQAGLSLVRWDVTDAAGTHALDERMSQAQVRGLLAPSPLMNKRKQSLRFYLRRSRCFPKIELRLQKVPAPPKTRFEIANLAPQLERTAAELIHLPGLRGNPQRWYPRGHAGDRFPGVFSPYAASIVAAWKQTGDERLGTLGAMLRAMNLTWKVEATELDDTRVELRVGRLPQPARGGARDLVNVADLGFGVSQVLPVLVALLAADKDQIVYVEQPELHLHPQAQVALAQCLLDAAARGVIVVAETHSPLLLSGVQEAVAAGRQPAELVKLHWFTRGRDGATTITSADLDQRGAFGPWPEDFSTVELDIEDRYLRAAAGV